jgi:hypothetical protein
MCAREGAHSLCPRDRVIRYDPGRTTEARIALAVDRIVERVAQ